jgi:hypothetical protein
VSPVALFVWLPVVCYVVAQQHDWLGAGTGQVAVLSAFCSCNLAELGSADYVLAMLCLQQTFVVSCIVWQ